MTHSTHTVLLSISLPALLRRHWPEIVQDDEYDRLKAALADEAREHDLMVEHSVSTVVDRLHKAQMAYANSPNAATKKALRELQAMCSDPQSSIFAQAAASRRRDEIQEKQIGPLAHVIAERLRTILEARLHALEEQERAACAEFEIKQPVPSSLLESLRHFLNRLGCDGAMPAALKVAGDELGK